MGEDELPAILTINEYSRRTKEIYASNPNIGKLTHLKNYFTININTDSPIIKKLIADAEEAIGKDFAEMTVTCDAMEDKKNAAESKLSNIPYAERTEADNAEAEAARKAAQDAKDARYNLVKEYADKNDIIHEIYDIALVQLGLLYGDRLMNFLKRSVKFIESHQEVTAAKTAKKAKKSKKED
jgi:molecular chaperone HtpG